MITLIACMGEGNVIGKDGDMPWKLPEDLKHFKKTTLGHTVVMGRKTYESIGSKPLPGRSNIVLSREGTHVEEILNMNHNEPNKEFFIMGGGEIYKQFMEYADKLIVTRILHKFEGDTFFPEIGPEWITTDLKEGITDERNPYAYYFITYERVSK